MLLTRAGNFLRSLKQSEFGFDVMKLAGGTTIAQAITVLSLPILARLYPADAFGTAGLFTSLVTIASVIACLRYEFAIMLPSSDEEAANVFGIAFMTPLLFGVLGAIFLVFAGNELVTLLNAPALLNYLWLLPIALWLAGMYQALNYWNSRSKRFGRLSVALVGASATSTTLQLTAGVAGQATAGGLIVGSTAGTAVATGALGIQIWRDQSRLLRDSIRPRRMRQNLLRFRKFPLVDSWGALVNNLAWQMPLLLLSVFFTQTIVGYYAMAFRTIQLPMALIGISIGQVFYQRASVARNDPEALSSVVLSVFDKLVVIMMIPGIFLTILGQDLFTVVLGKQWAEAGFYVQLLGPWTLVWFIASPLSSLFSVLEYQGRALVVHLSVLLSRTAALIIGGVNQNIELALLLFSASGILVYGGVLVWVMKLSGVPIRAALDVLLRHGRYGLLFAATVLAIKWFGGSHSILVLLASAGLAALYYLWIFRRSLIQKTMYQSFEQVK